MVRLVLVVISSKQLETHFQRGAEIFSFSSLKKPVKDVISSASD